MFSIRLGVKPGSATDTLKHHCGFETPRCDPSLIVATDWDGKIIHQRAHQWAAAIFESAHPSTIARIAKTSHSDMGIAAGLVASYAPRSTWADLAELHLYAIKGRWAKPSNDLHGQGRDYVFCFRGGLVTENAVPHARGQSLELGLERFKRLSDLTLEFLQRLYDGHSVVEKYRDSDRELHVCLAPVALYVQFRSAVVRRDIAQGGTPLGPGLRRVEFTMPVLIRPVSENPRPLHSVVRLQPLNECDMGRVDSREYEAAIPGVFPACERLRIIFNRELSASLSRARIMPREFINEVLKGGPEVVADLPDQDAEPYRKNRLTYDADNAGCGRDGEWRAFVQGIRLVLAEHPRFLIQFEASDSSLQAIKMLAGPIHSLERTVERMDLHGVPLAATEDAASHIVGGIR